MFILGCTNAFLACLAPKHVELRRILSVYLHYSPLLAGEQRAKALARSSKRQNIRVCNRFHTCFIHFLKFIGIFRKFKVFKLNNWLHLCSVTVSIPFGCIVRRISNDNSCFSVATMATSLAAQLQRLAAPQTSLLYDKRKQPSILFDASQAASKDREVIYDIGISGLHELIQLNSAFAQFEDTLFDKTSIDLQRLVENKELNQKLDTNIRKFFFHVSPYFLLQPAHKCLEWLIRRFQIHEFNREDFVRLILPYHETLMFVRCVQILAMPGKNDPLYWLSGVKKSGSPLAKKAIINHAVGYPGFLRSYGEFLERAVQELDSKANVLQAMIAFYCTITIGVLDAVDSVNENLVTSILKTLTKGLNSKAIDFTAACYMIIGHLVTKASLAKKALETFLTRLCVLMHPSLEGDAAMVMVLITDTQKKQLGQFSDSLVASILGAKWLPFALARIKKDGVNVTPLFRAILEKCLKKICQQDEQLETYEKFCEGLLLGITLDANESEAIIQ